MLNKNQSNKSNSWKYIVVFPALVAFVFLFQIEIVAQEKESKTIEKKLLKDQSTEIIVTKNTTDEEIKKYCEELKKTHDIDLVFFNIKRNSSNEIINIKSEFKDNTGDGSSETSENPIKPFKFFYDGNKKETGYNMDLNLLSDKEISNSNKTNTTNTNEEKLETSNNTVAQLEDKNVIRSISSQDGTKPIIIIDGTEADSNFKIEELDPENIQSINVLKGYQATMKYNESGKNGVIEIILKEKLDLNNLKPIPRKTAVGFQTLKQDQKVSPWKVESAPMKNTLKEVNGWKVESELIKEGIKQDVATTNNINYNEVIIIIDGKISNSRKFKQLNPNKITSIEIQKFTDASQKIKDEKVKLYGEKALNGIIKVETKPLFK